MIPAPRLPAEPPVCVDGRMLPDNGTPDNGTPNNGTGISTYAETLVAALRCAGKAPAILTAPSSVASPIVARARRWLAALSPGPWRAERSPDGRFQAPAELFRIAQVHFSIYRRLLPIICDGPSGIMHWTYPVPLYVEGWRNIYTIHDAIPLARPDLTDIEPRRHRRLLECLAGRADRFVTVSASAREEIVRHLGCPPDFVVDCGAAAPENRSSGPKPAASDHYLFCGTIEPRKNSLRLAQAHHLSGSVRPLFLVGPDGWRAAETRRALNAFPRVRLLSYVERNWLSQLMASARALLFPSLAEGFGLPVIEAMAMGTPVMTSAGGALEEVAGGAALLVDPCDVAAMAGAIRALDRQDLLRARLRKAGRARARDFTLERFAERLRPLYEEVGRGKHG